MRWSMGWGRRRALDRLRSRHERSNPGPQNRSGWAVTKGNPLAGSKGGAENICFKCTNRQCPVSPGPARYFLAVRQESTQRSAPSSPPATPVPSLQALNAAAAETRFAQTAAPDFPALPTFRSAAQKGRRTAPLSALSPTPSRRERETTKRSFNGWLRILLSRNINKS
jgi:hypothetical protein